MTAARTHHLLRAALHRARIGATRTGLCGARPVKRQFGADISSRQGTNSLKDNILFCQHIFSPYLTECCVNLARIYQMVISPDLEVWRRRPVPTAPSVRHFFVPMVGRQLVLQKERR